MSADQPVTWADIERNKQELAGWMAGVNEKLREKHQTTLREHLESALGHPLTNAEADEAFNISLGEAWTAATRPLHRFP